MESYKKVKHDVKNEKFGCKDYILNLPLSKAQTLIKHKYSMTEHIKMNFKGNKEYERALWKCKYCFNQDSEIHLLWCPQYENLRDNIDFNNDSDLCQYLQEIYKKRSIEENE